MLRVLFAVLTAACVLVHAETSLSQFHLSISAADPVLLFSPIGARTPDTQGGTDASNAPTGAASVTENGWELSYSGTDIPAANVTYVTIGSGTPKRSTSTTGAKATIKWVGTGVFFYGNTTDAAGFSISVDGFPTNVNGKDGVLGGLDNLPYKQHTAVLTVKSGTVDLYGATLVTALETQGFNATEANVTEISTVAGADKHINPAFVATSTDGTPWAGRWDWAGTAWDHVGTTGQHATLAYAVPANTSYLVLYGGTAAVNGDYQVSFSPALTNDGTGSAGSEYNTWRGQDVLLWAGPLDPAQTYNMMLSTVLRNWWIDVSKVKVWSALDPHAAPSTNGTTSGGGDTGASNRKNSSVPIGAIVGGVVGGVGGALVLGLLLWWFLRRRRHDRRSPLDILDSDTQTEYHHKDMAPEPVVARPHQIIRDATLQDEDAVLLSPYPVSGQAGPSPSSSATASTNAPASPMSSKQNQAQSRPREITQQEMDAGAVVVNVVPPSYDPSWSVSAAASATPHRP